MKAIKKNIWVFFILIIFSIPTFPQEIINAIKQGNIEKVKELLDKDPGLVHERDRVNYTPLHWAAMLRNKEMAELLISKNADINDKSNRQHLTPLQCALMFRYGNDPAVLDFLLDNGSHVECAGDEGKSNLLVASASGYERLAHLLLTGGVDVNSRSKYGLTALHIAAWTGHTHMVEFLIKKGADIDAASLDGRRPITMARESEKQDIIDLLLSNSADNSPQRFPVLKGNYLGMREPGRTPEIFGLGIVSTENREHSSLVFSPDGKELFFTIQFQKPQGGYGQDMFVTRMEDDRWTKPQKLFKTTYSNNCGSFSSDGKRLYFHSNRPIIKNGDIKRDTDIWFIEKNGKDWSEPVHLEAPINSDKMDVGPRITNSGVLYFSSDRDGENADIYRAAFINGRFSNPEKILGYVNTENYEAVCYVAPDETFLLYYYIYPEESFVPGLMISFCKEDGSWAKPVDMKEKLGLKANDLLAASLSPDGKYLFILDDRDIYWVDAKIIEEFRNHKQEIHQAVKEGKFDTVKNMLEKAPDLVNAVDSDGLTPLHLASEHGHQHIVELLLQKGADINAKSGFKRTPLHFAASSGRYEIVKLFIEKDAELNENDSFILTPIFQAAYNGHQNIVEMLLSNGINLSDTEKNSVTLLHAAAISGNPELVEMLLDKGIDRDVRNIFGKTPLHFAASRGHKAAVKRLIDQGADINIRSLDGRTPLQTAIDCDQKETADLLKAKGADSGPRQFIVPEGRYFGQKPPGLKPEIFAPGIITTDGYEFAITFSPDGKELFFTRRGGEKNYPTNYLMVCRYENNRWTEPEIAFFSGKYFDFESHISPDGKRLYFGTQRPKPPGIQAEGDIWFLEKIDHGWGEPKFLDAPVNNGFAMYVTSARNGNLYYTGVDGLYRSVYKNGKYLKPEKLKNENDEFFSGAHPFIAPDESYLIFDSDPGLMISFQKKDGTWTKAKEMGIVPNMCPSVSPDGKYLFFSRHGNLVWVDAKIIEILKLKNLK